jgi:hypothetical protein
MATPRLAFRVREGFGGAGIVQLNLIRSIVTLLDLIADALVNTSPSTRPCSQSPKSIASCAGALYHCAVCDRTSNGALVPLWLRSPPIPGPAAPYRDSRSSQDGWRRALQTRPQDAQEDARAVNARVCKVVEVTGVVVGCAEHMKAL